MPFEYLKVNFVKLVNARLPTFLKLIDTLVVNKPAEIQTSQSTNKSKLRNW